MLSPNGGIGGGIGVSTFMATLVLGVFVVSAIVTVALGLYLFGII